MSRMHIFFYFFLVGIILLCNIGFHSGENRTRAVKPEFAYFNHRKLMLHDRLINNYTCTRRINFKHTLNPITQVFDAGVCTKWDISISQSRYPTPGIPQYIVQIVNTCTVPDCSPSNIHLHCGWFASARIVNPTTFKRLSFDDCLVNGGHPLRSSQSIRFTYANSFMYPLQFKSANFCNSDQN